jgi:hypothetical protein
VPSRHLDEEVPVKLNSEVIVVAFLAVTLWCASHGSSAKCVDQDDSGFALHLVNVGGDHGWPSEASLNLNSGIYEGELWVDLGKEGRVFAERD